MAVDKFNMRPGMDNLTSDGPKILRGASLRCETLTDPAAIERVAPAWNDLLERSRCNRGFSSPIWFLATCKVHPEMSPWLALAWHGERLAGVLPLAVSPEGTAIFPSTRSDYHDVVVADGDTVTSVRLLEYARAGSAPFRRMELKPIRQDSNLASAIDLLNGHERIIAQRIPDQEASYIELASTCSEYLATRSHALRKGVSRATRKAAADGIVMRELTPADFPAQQLASLFFELHYSRFGDQSAFHREPRHAAFVEMALPVLFTERRLHVFVMQRDRRTLALDLCFRGVRSLCTWNGGYPTEAECWSPGRMLLLFGLQRAHELGLEEYDLLRGKQAWKTSWANRNRRLEKIIFDRCLKTRTVADK
jgi:CelD/BcsL family acetyltransferase involved in cellulose biosynthesis